MQCWHVNRHLLIEYSRSQNRPKYKGNIHIQLNCYFKLGMERLNYIISGIKKPGWLIIYFEKIIKRNFLLPHSFYFKNPDITKL